MVYRYGYYHYSTRYRETRTTRQYNHYSVIKYINERQQKSSVKQKPETSPSGADKQALLYLQEIAMSNVQPTALALAIYGVLCTCTSTAVLQHQLCKIHIAHKIRPQRPYDNYALARIISVTLSRASPAAGPATKDIDFKTSYYNRKRLRPRPLPPPQGPHEHFIAAGVRGGLCELRP